MVWSAISWYGKTDLVIVEDTLDAVAYLEMLDQHLMPFFEDNYPGGCVFQQDGASAHRAQQTRDFLWGRA